TATNRRHRRRPVRFQNVRHQPHRVRKFCLRRQQARQRAFRQSTVTDFTASRPAQKLHFTDAERREVVVQQKPLELILLEQQVQPLHVFLGSQSQRRQRLCLAAGKQRRTVYAWQQSRL